MSGTCSTWCRHHRALTRATAGFATKLSSAGLVYKHFGREVVASLMGVPAAHADVETVYLKIYGSFMEALDAIDNGEAHASILRAHTFLHAAWQPGTSCKPAQEHPWQLAPQNRCMRANACLVLSEWRLRMDAMSIACTWAPQSAGPRQLQTRADWVGAWACLHAQPSTSGAVRRAGA